MKTLSALLIALALVTVPFTTGCFFRCEGGPQWQRYAEDRAAVTIDAGTPALVPLTVSAPARAPGDPNDDHIAIEIAVTDCSGGDLTLDVRMLAEDGTEIEPSDGLRLVDDAGVQPIAIHCPNAPVVFEVASASLTCTGARCSAPFTIELSSATGAGPREVEARLVNDTCSASDRTDAAIDAWGE